MNRFLEFKVMDMKKILFRVFVLITSVMLLVACSVHNSDEQAATTAVTDENGITHYYEVITDEAGVSQLREIEASASDKPAVSGEAASEHGNTETVAASKNDNDADNEVLFEFGEDNSLDIPQPNITEAPERNNNTVTNQLATDKDGWINKWY